MFGPHLTLDAVGCPKELLMDLDRLAKFLDKLPESIGMTKIMPPYVFRYCGLVEEDAGISGVVLLAESHASCHFFEHKETAFLDIFSCKDFDVQKAIAEFSAIYKPVRTEHRLFSRGREFPRSESRSTQIIESERVRLSLKDCTLE
jgi:S-adenosylmethionine decarboxylase